MRKQTKGRNYRQLPVKYTIAHTVMVKHGIGGYKEMEDAKKSFDVEDKITDDDTIEARIQRSLDKAINYGLDIFEEGNFNIIPKTIKTSKLIYK